MRPAPALLALFLAALAGCGDPVETPGLAGEWTGTTRDANELWTFTFDDARNLTGSFLVSDTFDRSVTGTFSGTYDHPSVTLHMRLDTSGTPSEYYATVNEELDRMTGSVVIGELSHTLNLTRTQ
ncbi:MAG: hypothetical protein OXL34_09560 [Gemmatimonadota bacterium]|nr:hypothetical protein [Gemmatimonadota bacterium]